jgi:hypothetical protein
MSHHYFYALTAHFGQWVAGAGRRARAWQVAAGLIDGKSRSGSATGAWCTSRL